MHIVFKKIDKWFEKSPGLKEDFQNTYDTIYEAAHKFAQKMNDMAKEKADVNVKIVISEQLLKQSLIDAFDDLSRLTDYHPTKEPNPIKKAAYIVFWFLPPFLRGRSSLAVYTLRRLPCRRLFRRA